MAGDKMIRILPRAEIPANAVNLTKHIPANPDLVTGRSR